MTAVTGKKPEGGSKAADAPAAASNMASMSTDIETLQIFLQRALQRLLQVIPKKHKGLRDACEESLTLLGKKTKDFDGNLFFDLLSNNFITIWHLY